MAAQPFWLDEGGDEQFWNFCWLGEDLLPGLVDIDVDASRAVDEKKSKSTDGPTITDEGYEGAKVAIKVRIWSSEQWRQWLRVLPNIHPQKGGTIRSPLAIINPEPNSYGIDTVYVKSISSSTPQRGGHKVIAIECRQWFGKTKSTKTSSVPKQTKDDPDQFGPPATPPVPL